MAAADIPPTVPISAELLLELSRAAVGLAFAVVGRVRIGGPEGERANARYHELADQADAVLTEHAPEWLERRVDEDLHGGGHRG